MSTAVYKNKRIKKTVAGSYVVDIYKFHTLEAATDYIDQIVS